VIERRPQRAAPAPASPGAPLATASPPSCLAMRGGEAAAGRDRGARRSAPAAAARHELDAAPRRAGTASTPCRPIVPLRPAGVSCCCSAGPAAGHRCQCVGPPATAACLQARALQAAGRPAAPPGDDRWRRAPALALQRRKRFGVCGAAGNWRRARGLSPVMFPWRHALRPARSSAALFLVCADGGAGVLYGAAGRSGEKTDERPFAQCLTPGKTASGIGRI
jgi:hypothetical protein